MHHATARGSVNRLVPTETIHFKRMSMCCKTNFNLAETDIPKIVLDILRAVLDILRASATHDVMIALSCAERQCVFEGAAGQVYSLLPGPNVQLMLDIRDFSKTGLCLWIQPENLLCYTEEDAKKDLASGTAKVFIEPAEVKRHQDGGHFGTLFAHQKNTCQII